MKRSQLKDLIKHIILEAQKNEMIVNKDYPPDVMGAVNVEQTAAAAAAPTAVPAWGKKKKLKEVDLVGAGLTAAAVYALWKVLQNILQRYFTIKANKDIERQKLENTPLTVETIDTLISALRKMKEVNPGNELLLRAIRDTLIRNLEEGKIQTELDLKIFVNNGVKKLEKIVKEREKKKNIKEKTLPDGKYVDDMLDGRQQKRYAGLREESPGLAQDRYARLKKAYNVAVKQGKESFIFDGQEILTSYAKYALEYLEMQLGKKKPMDEMTTSSAAGGQEGGTIKVPAWGTRNRLGSPGAIKATKKMKGWKVVKSITDEGK